MSTQVHSAHLAMEYFRGFTMKHANELTFQLGDGGEHIVIVLNNCEANPAMDDPVALANFAAEVCSLIKERKVANCSISYWDMPTAQTSGLQTRRQADAAALQVSLVDADIKGNKKYFGVVVFQWDGGSVDIREIGLQRGLLRLIAKANWAKESQAAREQLTAAARRGERTSLKSRGYKDIRAIIPTYQSNVHRFHATIRVSNNVMGLLVGPKGRDVAAVQDQFAVRITTTSKGFTVEGETEQDILDAVSALEARLPGEIGSNGRDGNPIEFSASKIVNLTVGMRYEDVFLNMAGRLCSAKIIGSKSIVCYTLLMDVIVEATEEAVTTLPSIVEVELIGLQSIFTRGNNDSWLNKNATADFLNAAQRYSASLVGLNVDISFEAMGYAQGNTRRNIHALMFHNNELLNADILRKGYCKLMQSARYYNPEMARREDPIRSLFPCMRNLLSVSKPNEKNGLSWCRTEFNMLMAERQAAAEGAGVWHAMSPEAPLIGQRPTPTSKRHVFIDNSNIWISGKHFSGERQGLGFDRARMKSEKLMANGKQWSELEVIYGVVKNNRLRQFVCDRRSYCASDRGWRLDIDRLLWLIGYDTEIDPNFYVAGSVPPVNEDIWNYMRARGSINILTGRTNEGQSSGEDTSLVTSGSNLQVFRSHDK